MEPDDVMPNDGTYFFPREPADQVIERKREKAQAIEFENILKELVVRWEEKIKFYESVRSIPEEVKLKPEDFLKIVNANAVVVEILESELEYLRSLIR